MLVTRFVSYTPGTPPCSCAEKHLRRLLLHLKRPKIPPRLMCEKLFCWSLCLSPLKKHSACSALQLISGWSAIFWTPFNRAPPTSLCWPYNRHSLASTQPQDFIGRTTGKDIESFMPAWSRRTAAGSPFLYSKKYRHSSLIEEKIQLFPSNLYISNESGTIHRSLCFPDALRKMLSL